jgi:hypothetical protein
MLVHFVRGNAYRAGQFRVGFTPRRWIARVDEGKRLTAIHAFLNFINRDSGYFHRSSLIVFDPIVSRFDP